MAENALVVSLRRSAGKGVARKLRAAGRIPGVCYGTGGKATAIELDPGALQRLLAGSDAGMNTLIDLRIEGGGEFDGRPVLIKELQRHPVDGRYLHADLFALDLEHTIQVAVPIHVTGQSEGVKLGGILDQSLRELELECMPRAIPKEVRVDVTGLNIGDSLHVRDLALPEGVVLKSDGDLAVVSIVPPIAEEVPAEAAPAVEGELAPPAEGEAAPAAEEAEAGD